MAQRKKLIRKFKSAGATTIDNAIDTGKYGIRHSLIFNKLVKDGVLINTYSNFFYLDEATEVDLQSQRIKIILMIISVLAILGSLYILIGKFM